MPAPPLPRFTVLSPTRWFDNSAGLVGWWTFDDGSLTDFSGNGNTGTLVGSPLPTVADDLRGGSCFKFDGNQNYITVANSASISPTAVSAFAWINPASFPHTTNCVINKQLGNSYYQLNVSSTG